MADGSLNLDLDEWLETRLKSGAAHARMTEREFVKFVLEQHLFSYDDFDWGDQEPGAFSEDELDPQGPFIPLEEALAGVRARLEAKIAGLKK